LARIRLTAGSASFLNQLRKIRRSSAVNNSASGAGHDRPLGIEAAFVGLISVFNELNG
jgi:hypothetical protein